MIPESWKPGIRDAWHPATLQTIYYTTLTVSCPHMTLKCLVDSHRGKMLFVIFWIWVLVGKCTPFQRSFNTHWLFQKWNYHLKERKTVLCFAWKFTKNGPLIQKSALWYWCHHSYPHSELRYSTVILHTSVTVWLQQIYYRET